MIQFLISVSIATLIALLFRRFLFGFMNPASLFAGVWGSLIGVFSLGILPYYEVEIFPWVLLLGSAAMFFGGCAAASALFLRRKPKPADTALDVDTGRLRFAALALYGLGLLMLFAYLSEIESRYTLARAMHEPWLLRRAVTQGEVGWSLRYFYFTMPAAILAFLHHQLTERYRWVMRVIIVTSVLFGTATTGRTAVIWLLAWIVCFYLYLPSRKKRFANRARLAVAVCLALVLAFAFFNIAGVWMGKSFSGLQRASTLDQELPYVVIPYYYFTANIPAFQNIVLTPIEHSYGLYTLLPMVKLLGPAFGFDPPTEVSTFTKTPYPCNTYTYLWPYYLDFGVPGVLGLPFLLGFGMTFLHLRLKTNGASLALLYLNSLLATAVIFSYGTNRLISTPTWWFILLAPLLGAFCGARRKSAVFAKAAVAPGSYQAGPVWLSRGRSVQP